MPHVSDFTKPQKEIVVDLVNATNTSNIAANAILLSNPEFVENDQVKVLIEPAPDSGYGGSVEVFYDRLDIQAFCDIVSPDGVVIPQGEAVSLVDLLPQINAQLGTALISNDVVDVPIEGWDGTPGSFLDLYLDMAAHSLVYYGSLKVTIDDNDIPLSSVITTTILNGLNLPVGDGGNGGSGQVINLQAASGDWQIGNPAPTAEKVGNTVTLAGEFIAVTAAGSGSQETATVFPEGFIPEEDTIINVTYNGIARTAVVKAVTGQLVGGDFWNPGSGSLTLDGATYIVPGDDLDAPE